MTDAAEGMPYIRVKFSFRVDPGQHLARIAAGAQVLFWKPDADQVLIGDGDAIGSLAKTVTLKPGEVFIGGCAGDWREAEDIAIFCECHRLKELLLEPGITD